MNILAITATIPSLFPVTVILLLLILLEMLPNTTGNVLSNKFVPRCEEGGCHCLGADIDDCPALPTIKEDTLSTFRALTHTNPMFIRCDPFQSKDCVITLEEGEACTIELIAPEITITESCPSGYSYRLATAPSLDEATAAGSYITHTGPCGTCSSLEDLALMIEYPNLTYKAQQCFWSSNGMADLNGAISCYQDIGFTLSCSRTLASYQKNIVDEGCGYQCSAWAYDGDLGRPSCEDKSGCEACLNNYGINKQFQLIAGRTYFNSGFPSQTAHQCSDIAPLDVIGGGDICFEAPIDRPPTESPIETAAPSIAPVIPRTAPPTSKLNTIVLVPVITATPVTATPVNPNTLTAVPLSPTANPALIVTTFPIVAPVSVPLPISSLGYKQCLNTAAIEVRMGAFSRGNGIVCDCSNAENGETNIPTCYSSADRNQATICAIQFGNCETVSDCCSAGIRNCRGNKCRASTRQSSRSSLRLENERGGAARYRSAVNDDGKYRHKSIRGRALKEGNVPTSLTKIIDDEELRW